MSLTGILVLPDVKIDVLLSRRVFHFDLTISKSSKFSEQKRTNFQKLKFVRFFCHNFKQESPSLSLKFTDYS